MCQEKYGNPEIDKSQASQMRRANALVLEQKSLGQLVQKMAPLVSGPKPQPTLFSPLLTFGSILESFVLCKFSLAKFM
jgi:hypothetical protein